MLIVEKSAINVHQVKRVKLPKPPFQPLAFTRYLLLSGRLRAKVNKVNAPNPTV